MRRFTIGILPVGLALEVLIPNIRHIAIGGWLMLAKADDFHRRQSVLGFF
jgi:hypothetical protein